MTKEWEREELKEMVKTLNDEEVGVLYALLLALTNKDAETLKALEAAKDTDNFELAREISRKYIESARTTA